MNGYFTSWHPLACGCVCTTCAPSLNPFDKQDLQFHQANGYALIDCFASKSSYGFSTLRGLFALHIVLTKFLSVCVERSMWENLAWYSKLTAISLIQTQWFRFFDRWSSSKLGIGFGSLGPFVLDKAFLQGSWLSYKWTLQTSKVFCKVLGSLQKSFVKNLGPFYKVEESMWENLSLSRRRCWSIYIALGSLMFAYHKPNGNMVR
jgi:hypothetical protein